MENHHFLREKLKNHYKWSCSIAMLNYQREEFVAGFNQTFVHLVLEILCIEGSTRLGTDRRRVPSKLVAVLRRCTPTTLADLGVTGLDSEN